MSTKTSESPARLAAETWESLFRAQVAVMDFELKNVQQRIRKRLEVTITAALHRTDEPFAFQASLFVAPLSVD